MNELMNILNTILSTASTMPWPLILTGLAIVNFLKSRRTWMSLTMFVAALFVAFDYARGLGIL